MDFQIETGFAPHPRTYRGVCEACGCDSETDGHRPVVHVSSVSIDHEDGLYTGLWLCGGCVREWGRALGMADVRVVEQIRSDADLLRSELAAARAQIASLEPVRAALLAVAPQAVAMIEAAEDREPCPDCGKLVKPQGLGAHRRAHGVSA